MIKFVEVGLKNWKNFGSIQIPVQDRLFIYGANASGKSNLLDAFRFLKEVANDGLQKAVNARGGIKKIRNLNARSPSYIEIAVQLRDDSHKEPRKWEYLLQFNSAGGRSNKQDVAVILERITANEHTIVERKFLSDDEDYLSRQYTLLEQPHMNKDFRQLYECFKTITYVNIVPQIIREADSFIPSISKEDFFGRNLLDTIATTPKKIRDSRLNAIAKVLRLAVPQFSDLEFVKDDTGRPHLQVKYNHFRPQGAYQREDQFSDGTLRLIGIIWAVLDGASLMLLEEPELYLHSEIVKQLPAFIAKAQKNKNGGKRQVIISSHSYDLLNTDTISPEEIVILRQGKEDTDADMADTVEAVRAMIDAGFTPAAAVIPQVTPEAVAGGQLSLLDLF